MKKRIITIFCFISIVSAQLLFAESVSLSTTIPSPFGVYNKLRLSPRPILSGPCQFGDLYVDKDNKLLNYCRSTGFSPSGEWSTVILTEELQAVEAYLLREISAVEGRMNERLKALRGETEEAFEVLRRELVQLEQDISLLMEADIELSSEVLKLRQDIKNDIEQLKTAITVLQNAAHSH